MHTSSHDTQQAEGITCDYMVWSYEKVEELLKSILEQAGLIHKGCQDSYRAFMQSEACTVTVLYLAQGYAEVYKINGHKVLIVAYSNLKLQVTKFPCMGS